MIAFKPGKNFNDFAEAIVKNVPKQKIRTNTAVESIVEDPMNK